MAIDLAEKYGIDLTKEGKTGCPRCIKNGNDASHNNLHVYKATSSAYCWACGFTIASAEHRAKMGWDDEEESEEEVMTKELITEEEVEQIKSYTGSQGKGSREITDETYKAYACRFTYDEETAEVVEVFYPYTENYAAAGYKVRRMPKEFYSVGKVGKDSELFGQWKWKRGGGKYVLICAGEVDALSAFQMLEDYRKSKGNDYDAIPVVSSAVGESGSYKQIQNHYEWLNSFSKIVICYDEDDAGKDAVKKLGPVLPKGKVFVMQLAHKDANEYLEKGKEKQFVSAFYSAKAWTPDGIVASGDLGSKVREAAQLLKIPLPPFMHELQSMMAGGIPLKTIINAGSASGTGKSTIVDEMTYYWIFNSPYKPGIVTLESDSGQYSTKLLSRHIGQKIDLIETVEEKMELLESDEIKQKEHNLYFHENGEHRFYLIEDRDGGIESMKTKIEELIIACNCQLIILDPIQDLLDGLSNEDQSVFMKWMKGMVKSHDVTFINISHVRKSQGGKTANSVGAELYEEDMAGTSAIFKSGACNLLFTRNKEAEDELERNTTYMKASKIRWTGKTGVAGKYYYDNPTHTMHDLNDWLSKGGGGF